MVLFGSCRLLVLSRLSLFLFVSVSVCLFFGLFLFLVAIVARPLYRNFCAYPRILALVVKKSLPHNTKILINYYDVHLLWLFVNKKFM